MGATGLPQAYCNPDFGRASAETDLYEQLIALAQISGIEQLVDEFQYVDEDIGDLMLGSPATFLVDLFQEGMY